MKALVLDFYVDEPACFGVPPYLSPYARYSAGALVCGGLRESQIDYLTVDQLRAQGFQLKENYELIVLVAGTTVPGKYLGGVIGTVSEVLKFLDVAITTKQEPVVLIGGPIKYASREIQNQISEKGGLLVKGDIEKYCEVVITSGISNFASKARNGSLTQKRTYEDVDRYAVAGAFLTNLHPNFPHLILEMETYRGCTRDTFCSFCTEAFYGKPVFRSLQGILEEFKVLHEMGNYYYRIGRQADIMTYLPHMDDFQNTFPRPNPSSLFDLYSGIRNVAPNLKLLHLDNMNPGLIATFPKESEEILKIITEYNTEGDTAAMGIESADETVIAKNDLKCTKEEALFAIELVNKYGSRRVNGIPKLLPGLNLLGGLEGETIHTFEKNFQFLKSILDQDLLLRRINIRRAVRYENTKLDRSTLDKKTFQARENRFYYYRDRIRKEIDEPMLKKTFPIGSLLNGVLLEQEKSGYAYGRPLGSYPITVKIPNLSKEKFAFQKEMSVVITGFQGRSIFGLPHPIPLNQLSDIGLREIPGISKNQASLVKANGPYLSREEFETKNSDIKVTADLVF